jgi:hypothetical protein
MRRSKLGLIACAGLVVLASCSKIKDSSVSNATGMEGDMLYNIPANGSPVAGQYIVVLKDEFFKANAVGQVRGYNERNQRWAAVINNWTGRLGLQIQSSDVFSFAVHGFVARLNQVQLDALSHDPNVATIEQDKYVSIGGGKPTGGGGGSASQTTSWGITRVGGAGDGTVLDHEAWIIDTGIQLDHPDLNVDKTNSQSFLDKTAGKNYASPYDENGHGTHVAGIIAAINNTIGTVGVAAGAKVVAVRVLDKSGSGTNSNVIKGVNYVAANASSGDVANMSLGGSTSSTLDAAVTSLGSAGIYVCVAAGNNSADASNYSPARVNATNVFTISSIGQNDLFSYFSNYGSPVDYAAPGENIISLYLNSGTATLSGTSMATPFVTGIMLLSGTSSINTNGTAVNDPDGTPDPIAHE